jgi:hypothetical protein
MTPAGPGRQRLNLPASSARAALLMAVGRLISWIVLLGVPAVCMAVAVLALAGGVDLDPMWVVFSLLLGAAFLHGAQCVRWDEFETVVATRSPGAAFSDGPSRLGSKLIGPSMANARQLYPR